jgi:hypothetical protein
LRVSEASLYPDRLQAAVSKWPREITGRDTLHQWDYFECIIQWELSWPQCLYGNV